MVAGVLGVSIPLGTGLLTSIGVAVPTGAVTVHGPATAPLIIPLPGVSTGNAAFAATGAITAAVCVCGPCAINVRAGIEAITNMHVKLANRLRKIFPAFAVAFFMIFRPPY